MDLIFKDKIHELAQIHKIEINIYSLDGKLLKSSKESFAVDKVAPPVPDYILKLVRSSIEKRFVDIKTIDGVKNRSSYSLIKRREIQTTRNLKSSISGRRRLL